MKVFIKDFHGGYCSSLTTGSLESTLFIPL